jgi:GTPase involved in cell partitioning and DNA repair
MAKSPESNREPQENEKLPTQEPSESGAATDFARYLEVRKHLKRTDLLTVHEMVDGHEEEMAYSESAEGRKLTEELNRLAETLKGNPTFEAYQKQEDLKEKARETHWKDMEKISEVKRELENQAMRAFDSQKSFEPRENSTIRLSPEEVAELKKEAERRHQEVNKPSMPESKKPWWKFW